MSKLLRLSIVIVSLTIIFGCAPQKAKLSSIQIKGSDTMINLVQAWAEKFMAKKPDSFVAVTGGGSGTGIASFINGTADIAACSRKMENKEIELAKKRGITPVEITVGLDGIAVVVHPSNPVEKLTISQLSDIFTGKITNWKQIGGNEGEIVLLSREVNSGTYVYFKEHVLQNKEYSGKALLLPSSQSIANEISQNRNAIGYYGMGYISPKQKCIKIAVNDTSPYVEPTIENVQTGNYYIARPLLMYHRDNPSELVKEFMDFILSEEGQKIVREIDFVPIKP